MLFGAGPLSLVVAFPNRAPPPSREIVSLGSSLGSLGKRKGV